MVAIQMDVKFNHAGPAAAAFRQLINRGVRKQVMVTEADVKTNIVKYGYVDTGNALGSTRGEMTGETEGQVSVSAESEQGFPYPVVGNYGSVHQAPRPFFSEAVAKAEQEFGPRVRREIEGAF